MTSPSADTFRPASGELAVAETRAWLDHAVIGLDLCPFARGPWAAGRVRIVACEADEPEGVLMALAAEMRLLAGADPEAIETTLLVHPQALLDFLDFNDFLDLADDALEALGLAGVLQIASFHPDYQFAGTEADDIGNATNRSPHPTLQLLREASVERAIGLAGGEEEGRGGEATAADAIIAANLQTFSALGAPGWSALQARCRRQAAATVAVGEFTDRLTMPPSS